MRLGVIDIGTNSVKLLVAEANGSIPRILLERVVITRIGEGLRDGGRLAQHAMDRTLRAVRGLVDEARRLGVLRARAVGTAAFRSASNRADFVRSLQRIGLRLEILSGRREADLSFAAATADLPIAGPVAVVDVGGGSAEMAWGTGSRRRRISLPLGAVRLTEQLLHNDPIQSADFQALLASIRATLRKALRTAGPLPGHVVAVGGTAATLAAMQLGLRRPVPERIHGLRLTRSQLYVLLIVLSLLTAQQRAAMPGLEPGRADIIVAGTAVLAATLGALRVSELTVSTRGLRYGVLLESLKSGARDKFA